MNNTNKPDIFWHYTSLEGALGILQSEELWLSHTSALNDPSEIQVGIEAFMHATIKLTEKIVKNKGIKSDDGTTTDLQLDIPEFDFIFSLWATLKQDLRKNTEFCFGMYLNHFQAQGSVGLREIYELFKQQKSQNVPIAKTELFIFSLSKNWDDLNQWRMYADNGKGIAIGFYDKECKFANTVYYNKKDNIPIRENTPKKEVEFIQMIYAQNKNDKIVKDMMNVLEFYMERIVPLLPWKNENKERDEIYRNCINAVMHLIYSLKHSCYINEQEWRFMKRLDEGNKKIKFRSNNNSLIPYTKVKIPKNCIKHIGLAPCAFTDSNVETLNFLQKQRQYDYQIILSKLPYKS